MTSRKGAASSVERIEILVRFEHPLGYGMMKPLDGRSLDEVLVEAWKDLNVRSGDVMRLTLVRLTPEKEADR